MALDVSGFDDDFESGIHRYDGLSIALRLTQ